MGEGLAAGAPRLLAPDPRHGWRRQDTLVGVLYSVGDPAAEKAAVALLCEGHFPSAEAFAAVLRPVRGCWALLIAGDQGVAAAVDHVRSLPLFYANGEPGVCVGDDAREVTRAAQCGTIDSRSAMELALAGYAISGRTLYHGLNQLVAGQVACWPAAGNASFSSHHVYEPSLDEEAPGLPSPALAEALDATFDRLVAGAAGRPVWVPLSGGLDSRLILAKLVERAYQPLVAFSYGPRHNSDATVARAVAERLGVAWRFVTTPGKQIRTFFASAERRDYWRFADGLCSVPNMQDVHPIAVLRAAGALPQDAMIVNGQTGDFISGGHIPQRLLSTPEISPADLFDAVIAKHFDLWKPLLTPQRVEAVHRCIAAALSIDPGGSPLKRGAAAAAFERFEYAERQAKFVVNGQRAYEWHGLAWNLPLWDRDIVELFARAPLPDRVGQALYRGYLSEWNFRGVFSDITHHVTAWPAVATTLLTPLAIGTRLILGRTRRDRLFRYLNYWNRFGTQYAAFGFATYARAVGAMRNPVSLYARTWLAELGIDPDNV